LDPANQFLTQKTLYVIAFDVRKFRPQHFQSMIMFFVAKLQSRIPAAPIILVGTHADEVKEGVAEQRCKQVLDALQAKQQRERRRLNAQILKLDHEMSLTGTRGALYAEKAEMAEQLRLLLGRLVQLPARVHAVSSAESMQNIPELREAIVASALDQKLFPDLGVAIPRLYDQIRSLVREWRTEMPYCDLDVLIEKVECALSLRETDAGSHAAEGVAVESTRERVLAALSFMHDLGELAHFKESRDLSQMVFLSLQWLVDVTKKVIRHDHSDALVYEEGMRGLMSPKVFEAAKQDFVRRGKLNLVLLRWLWRDLRVGESTFARLVCMLQQFELAMATTVEDEAVLAAESSSTDITSTDAVGSTASVALEKPELFLLVPAFFPDYLPPRCWRVHCPEGQLQVVRWFDFADACPAGLMQRLQVLLYLEWPVGKHVLAKEGVVLVVGSCRVLVQLLGMADGTSEHEGLQLITRGKKDADGLASREQWDTVERIVARVQQLLTQWPGIVVKQFAQWLDSSGFRSEWLVVELQRLRQAGHSNVACDIGDSDDGTEQKAEVALDLLLGLVREGVQTNGQVNAMAQQLKELQQRVIDQTQALKALQRSGAEGDGKTQDRRNQTALICLSCPTEHQSAVVPLCKANDVCILFGQIGDELDRLRTPSEVRLGEGTRTHCPLVHLTNTLLSMHPYTGQPGW
jgi:hypothetical protein